MQQCYLYSTSTPGILFDYLNSIQNIPLQEPFACLSSLRIGLTVLNIISSMKRTRDYDWKGVSCSLSLVTDLFVIVRVDHQGFTGRLRWQNDREVVTGETTEPLSHWRRWWTRSPGLGLISQLCMHLFRAPGLWYQSWLLFSSISYRN